MDTTTNARSTTRSTTWNGGRAAGPPAVVRALSALFIGAGMIPTPATGAPPSPGDTALIASTVAGLFALLALVTAGAATAPARKGARA
jgi:hypothetical protein